MDSSGEGQAPRPAGSRCRPYRRPQKSKCLGSSQPWARSHPDSGCSGSLAWQKPVASKGQTGPGPLGCVLPWVLCTSVGAVSVLLSHRASPAFLTMTEAAAAQGRLLAAASAPSPSCLVLSLDVSNKAHGSYIMCSENLPFVSTRVDFQPSFCPWEADREGVRSHEGKRAVSEAPAPSATLIHPEGCRGGRAAPNTQLPSMRQSWKGREKGNREGILPGGSRPGSPDTFGGEPYHV